MVIVYLRHRNVCVCVCVCECEVKQEPKKGVSRLEGGSATALKDMFSMVCFPSISSVFTFGCASG